MSKSAIHIFGASGSGTSALGRYISDRCGYFFMDTDDYFWEKTDPPFTAKRAPSERVEALRADIEAHEGVVISGSLTGWGDVFIPDFTLAIRVETETSVRLERIRQRERKRFGERIDPGGDMYKKHEEFLEWAASYDDGGLDIRSCAMHDEWQKLLTCPLVTVDGGLPFDTNFGIIKKLLHDA